MDGGTEEKKAAEFKMTKYCSYADSARLGKKTATELDGAALLAGELSVRLRSRALCSSLCTLQNVPIKT